MNEYKFVCLEPTIEYLNRTFTLGFEFYYDNGDPIDLLYFNNKRKLIPVWYLSRYYDFDNPLLIKKMLISGYRTNYATVQIKADESKDFDPSKYSHQPILVLDEDLAKRYGKAEGDIILRSPIFDFEGGLR